jgi:nucleotide-binding universal stress UspA family protein
MTLGVAVGADGSDTSDAAIRWAAREAALHAAPLTLVHVVTPPTMVAWQEPLAMTGYGEWQQQRAREILDTARLLAEETAPGVEVSTQSVAGPSVATLIDLTNDTLMMVVGCRGLGALGRAFLGSVSRALVHHAHCPVAVIHGATVADDAPVVVGIDGSPASERAVAMAFDEAARRRVGLVAVHAWNDAGVMDFPGFDFTPLEQEANEVLGERLAGWQESYPDVAVERVVAFDRPVTQLLLQAERAQLLVVGSHGRGGFAGMLLGSVSSAVVNSATVPVLVARQG